MGAIYTCPQCEDYYTAKDWNEATINYYRATSPRGHTVRITTLEEAVGRGRKADFVCPSCEANIYSDEIEIHPDSYADNQSAATLLQKEW